MCSADVIDTARLKLRPLCADDARRLAELASDPQVSRMTTRIPHPYGLADAEGFIAAQAANASGRVFAIQGEGERLIGVVGLHSEPPTPWPELGYWLGRDYWGRGYATEAARAVVDWARAGGRRALASSHFSDNPASGRVLEKTGFLYTGDRDRRLSAARGEAAELRRMAWLA